MLKLMFSIIGILTVLSSQANLERDMKKHDRTHAIKITKRTVKKQFKGLSKSELKLLLKSLKK